MRAGYIPPNFRIAVVGAGAIGCYYGGKLAHFGRDVHFLMRSDYEAVRKRGLRIHSKGENIHVAKITSTDRLKRSASATSSSSRSKPLATRRSRHSLGHC